MIPKYNSKGEREGERETPEETIESKDPYMERGYTKEPRGELVDITKESHETSGEADLGSMYKLLGKRRERPFMFLHNHRAWIGSAIPSIKDYRSMVSSRGIIKTYAISEVGPNIKTKGKTGETWGHTMLYDKFIDSSGNYRGGMDAADMAATIDKFDKEFPEKEYAMEHPTEYYQKLIDLSGKIGFDIRFHPAEGYYFDKNTGNYEKKSGHSLEGAVASIIIGFSLLFLLIKVPLTGFIISDSISANYGAGLFMVSGLLFAVIVYLMLRRFIRKS